MTGVCILGAASRGEHGGESYPSPLPRAIGRCVGRGIARGWAVRGRPPPETRAPATCYEAWWWWRCVGLSATMYCIKSRNQRSGGGGGGGPQSPCLKCSASPDTPGRHRNSRCLRLPVEIRLGFQHTDKGRRGPNEILGRLWHTRTNLPKVETACRTAAGVSHLWLILRGLVLSDWTMYNIDGSQKPSFRSRPRRYCP